MAYVQRCCEEGIDGGELDCMKELIRGWFLWPRVCTTGDVLMRVSLSLLPLQVNRGTETRRQLLEAIVVV